MLFLLKKSLMKLPSPRFRLRMTWSNFPGAEIRGAEDDGDLLVPGRAQDEGGAGTGDCSGQRPGQRQHLGQIPAAAAHRWGIRSF